MLINVYNYKTRDEAIKLASELDLSKHHQVKITCKRAKRSVDHNALYWMWLTCIEQETGNYKNDLHDLFREKYLGYETYKVLNLEKFRLKSTTELDTSDDSKVEESDNSMDLAMYFRGRPVTGSLGDKEVWTKKALIAIGVEEFSLDAETLNKLVRKEDIALELLTMEGKSIGTSPGDEAVSGKPDKEDEIF